MKIKKWISYLVVVAMVMITAVPSFADDTVIKESSQNEEIQIEEMQDEDAQTNADEDTDTSNTPEIVAAEEPETEAATSGKCGPSCNWYWDAATETITIRGTGATYDITDEIPEEEEFDGFPWTGGNGIKPKKAIVEEGITELSPKTFSNDTALSQIQLPQSLKKIGAYVFEYTNLESIYLPESVEDMDDDAFRSVQGNSELTLYLLSTHQYAIDYAKRNEIKYSILSATSGDLTDTIQWRLHDGTLEITGTGDMPDYEEFGDTSRPWYDYYDQVRNVVVGEGITSIGDFAFTVKNWKQAVSNLQSVTLPNGLIRIGKDAFAYAPITTIDIPKTVTTLDSAAFEECKELTSISLPDSITTMGESCFFMCTALSDLRISQSLTRLESQVFNSCEGLTEVTIPEGITFIHSEALKNNDHLSLIRGVEGSAAERYAKEHNINFEITKHCKHITAAKTSYSINCGTKPFVLDASVQEGGDLTYSSSNSKIVTVDESGLVTPVAPGKATITITTPATDEFAKGTAKVTITVSKGKQTITTGKKSYSVHAMDAPFSLDAKTNGDGKLTFKSSNKKVLTVSSKGVVTIKKVGKAYVTIKAAGTSRFTAAPSKKVKITISKSSQKITPKQTSYTVYKGDKPFNLGVKRVGNGKVTYSSSNKKIATVSKKGTVTIKKPGTVKITIKAAKTSKCKAAKKVVTIKILKTRPAPEPVTPEPETPVTPETPETP